MTPADPRERAEIREALQHAHALDSIDRKLGQELITAAREVVIAWEASEGTRQRMMVAVARLRQLVGP